MPIYLQPRNCDFGSISMAHTMNHHLAKMKFMCLYFVLSYSPDFPYYSCIYYSVCSMLKALEFLLFISHGHWHL